MVTSCKIEKIEVIKLFGHYNYRLFLNKNTDNKFLILYGDNGCGKSTVLNLAFHLLAPEKGEGHKTAIAKIPFKSFSIDLSNGVSIVAERTDKNLCGGYILSIFKNRKVVSRVEFICNNIGRLITKEGNDEAEEKFWNSLRKINTCYNLLSDNRIISISNYSNRNEDFDEYDFMLRRERFRERNYYNHEDRNDAVQPKEFQSILLMRSIFKAERWLSRNFMKAASQGESNVNSLYGEILRALSDDSLEHKDNEVDKNTIIEKIKDLESQSQNFSRYGLLPSFYTKELISILKNANGPHLQLMVRTLNPYLRSIEKKIDALKEPYNRVDIFIKTLNKFFYDKEINMDINSGLKIKSKYGDDIKPSMLSSGERHLLLLFCNSLIMDKSSIIMIDEPEISLNIKWQRMLLSSLMSISENQPVQYIFATHSIELLSEFSDHVIKFEHIQEMTK